MYSYDIKASVDASLDNTNNSTVKFFSKPIIYFLSHTFSSPTADDIPLLVTNAGTGSENVGILRGDVDNGDDCGEDEAHVYCLPK